MDHRNELDPKSATVPPFRQLTVVIFSRLHRDYDHLNATDVFALLAVIHVTMIIG